MHASPVCLDFFVPGTAGNMRLDALLGLFLPGLGLRARRRLWRHHLISVNGKAQAPGFIPRPGDAVSLRPLMRPPSESGPSPQEKQPPSDWLPQVAAADTDFIAVIKPPGMHSAHIAGSPAPSVEQVLAKCRPVIRERWMAHLPVPDAEKNNAFTVPLLLTRLDRPTSGLLLAARHENAARRFRAMEKAGQAKKLYYALVAGKLEERLVLRRRLDTRNRSRTLVMREEEPDAARHSLVTPLRRLTGTERNRLPEDWEKKEMTLVQVEIQRGARHQIRAHLADAGFALLGDALYSPGAGQEKFPHFLLHHARLELPGFTAECLPDWPFQPCAPPETLDFYCRCKIL